MEIRRVAHGSADYQWLIDLRLRLLRVPLGLGFTEADLEEEACDVFLGAFDGETAIGSAVLTVKSPTEVQMRQVAVADNWQGQGIGTALVKESEQVGAETGFTKMVVSARLPAVAFYQGLGYELVGEEYVEVGIPHRRLEKDLP